MSKAAASNAHGLRRVAYLRVPKKPGPRGPGLKFASVGAPANHLPEGKNCAHGVANLGGSRPRMSRSKICIMQTHPATHNAAVGHASHALWTIVRTTCVTTLYR